MKALACTLALLFVAGIASAQPAPGPMPEPEPTPTLDATAPPPATAPATVPAGSATGEPNAETPTATEAPRAGLRVHVMTSENTYVPMSFDVFDVMTRQVVASASGAVESSGEQAPILDLKPGTYKIVRAGEPFESRVDFAIATVIADTVTDYLIVVDADALEFRGSGPVFGELPRGVEIAGLRLTLNGGGSVMFNQRVNAVGMTSGTYSQFGVFGNFGLLYDNKHHFFDANAEMRLDLVDPYTGSVMPTNDRFSASALYSYKVNNPYFGPYVRGAMRTRIFPGYLYVESSNPETTVSTYHPNTGKTDFRILGDQATPDDLRVKVASPFGPLLLQEELGANVKAIDLDLLLVKLHVATRFGFGFRQGFMNGLLVVQNGSSVKEGTNPIQLREVLDYNTLGPVLGANAHVTFARWLYGAAQFGVMMPFIHKAQMPPVPDNGSTREPTFAESLLLDFSGTAGFKVPILANLLFASADYTFRVERDAFITNGTQFEHSLMARATVTLF